MSSAGMPTVQLTDPTMRWEYRVALLNVSGLLGPNVDVDQLGQYLSAAGDEGWELAAVEDINRGQGATAALLVILKRPRQG